MISSRSVAVLIFLVGSTGCPESNGEVVAPQDRDACNDDPWACAIAPDARAQDVGSEPTDDRGHEDGETAAGDAPADDEADTGTESAAPEADAAAAREASDDATPDASDAGISCENGVKDGIESDVDCGGSCRACDVNRACSTDGDCMTGNCASSFCALASGPPDWIKVSVLSGVPGPLKAAVMTYGNPPGTMVTMVVTGTGNDGPTTDTFAAFDFKAATWSSGTLPSTRRAGAMAADPAGRVYLLGGDVTQGWSYDGNAWTATLAPSPTSRLDPAVATGSDGIMYEIGGVSGATPTGIVEAYDPVLDRWTSSSKPMPTARAWLGAVALDDRIYAMGGWVAGQPPRTVNVVEAYDVRTRSWSTPAPLVRPVVDFATVAAPDGRIYVAGGSTTLQLNATAAVAAYDPASNRWMSLPPLSKPRMGVAAVVAPAGRIYLLGDGMQPTSDVEAYGPVVTVTPSHAVPGATLLVTGSNFAANATVRVYLGTAATGTLLKTGPSSPAGALIPSITAAVPNVASGNKVITVVDDKSRYPITLAFTVD
jgi:hypothetical protein